MYYFVVVISQQNNLEIKNIFSLYEQFRYLSKIFSEYFLVRALNHLTNIVVYRNQDVDSLLFLLYKLFFCFITLVHYCT